MSICNVGLSLSKLGQVEGSNLFSLFNLLLVGLNLALELINQSLHALMVLAIFISSKGQLLDAPLRASQIFGSIGEASAFGIQLRLEFSDASFHLVHCLLSSLQCISFSGV